MTETTRSEGGLERRRTAHLLLRRPAAEDLDWMTALHADPLNYTHAPDRAHSPAQARTLSQSLLRAWETDPVGYWIVDTRHPIPGLPPGAIGMAGVQSSPLAGRACFNLYFRFRSPARGRGLAGEACREALRAAAEVEPGWPVVVRTRAANAPARRLAVRLGLTRRAELDAITAGYVVYTLGW